MKRIFSMAILGLLVTGCVSENLERFYSPVNIETADCIPCMADPVIERRSGNSTEDVFNMMEFDYAPIGVLAFEGGEYDGLERSIFNLAKKNHAEKVLVYGEYVRTESGSGAIPMTTYNTTFVTTPNGFGGFSSTPVTTSNTSYIPYSYSNRRFNYEAVFYCKVTNPSRFGAAFSELSEQEARSIGSRDHIKIHRVIRGKPAWKCNLFAGDIILEANGQKATIELIRQLAEEGDVTVKILRDGKEKVIVVKIPKDL